MINPYAQKNFFLFFITFFKRLFSAQIKHLASDEIQILVLSMIAITAAIVGVFLIHRKMTMLANALSHTVIFGIVITFLILKKSFQTIDPSLNFSALFVAALITGLLTAFLAQWLSQISSLQKEASIGLVFTFFFALGILLITLFSKNGHIGIDMIMGNVDVLHVHDLKALFYLMLVILGLALIFFRGLKVTTFDPVFAKLQNFYPSLFNLLIVFMLSMTSIGAFRAIGVVLVLAFFIVPPLFAQLFARSLESQIILACLFAVSASVFGVALSRHFLSTHQLALSTGGLTVLTLYTLYFFGRLSLFLYKKKKQRNWIKTTFKSPSKSSIA